MVKSVKNQPAPPQKPADPGIIRSPSGQVYLLPSATEALHFKHGGPRVKELQELLNAAGAKPKVKVDGFFSTGTANALQKLTGSNEANEITLKRLNDLAAINGSAKDGFKDKGKLKGPATPPAAPNAPSSEPATRLGVGALTGPSAEEAPGEPNKLEKLKATPNFQGLSAEQRKELLEVFNANPVAQQQLLELARKTTLGAPPRKANVLIDLDKNGNTLIDNLHQLSTQPLSPELQKNGFSNQGLVFAVTSEATTPTTITQNSKGVCHSAALQVMLCRQNPSEYARLMTGLVSPEGKAQLRDGGTLRRVPDSIEQDSAISRSDPQRLLQAALTEYGNGDEVYSNKRDVSIRADGTTHQGLDDDGTAKIHAGLFGGKPTVHVVETPVLGVVGHVVNKAFNVVMDHQLGDADEVMTVLKARSGRDTLVHLRFSDDPKKENNGHAVVVTRIENGRVFFDNPQGPTGFPKGSEVIDPLRRIENEQTGEQSMTEEDFRNRLFSVTTP